MALPISFPIFAIRPTPNNTITIANTMDTLPWDVREVANLTLFARLSWARDLVHEVSDPVLAFLQSVPLLGALAVDDLTLLLGRLSL